MHAGGSARSAAAAGGVAAGGRATGPRIFVGKLNKDTTEGDVKVGLVACAPSDIADSLPIVVPAL